MKDVMEQKANELLSKCPIAALSSITENGYPRVCMMAKLKTDNFKKLYFATGVNSKKVAHFLANPKAGVSYYEGNDSVTLTGNIEISQDIELKKQLWEEDFAEYYTGGVGDPSYCILTFTAKEALVSIGNQCETLQF
jgi:general stress protein 26